MPACLAVGAALALFLAACGEDPEPVQTTAAAKTGAEPADGAAADVAEAGGDTQSATEHAAIEDTLAAVLEDGDPASACEGNVTTRYVRRAYGNAAKCERAVARSKMAKAVRVREVVVLPDSIAQALVRPRGGRQDGDVLRAELVLDGSEWKLDSLRANVPVGP